MADRQSMPAPELVAKTLLDEHGDVLRDAVAMVVAQLMEAEVSAEIGAAYGEVSATRRPTSAPAGIHGGQRPPPRSANRGSPACPFRAWIVQQAASGAGPRRGAAPDRRS
jgi:hypothetical protein